MRSPSDHLLRTFASVPVSDRVLDLGASVHVVSLARLGFDLHACATGDEAVAAARASLGDAWEPEAILNRIIAVVRLDALGYPDAFFDWVVAYVALDEPAASARALDVLGEVRRVLKPGGWVYVVIPAEQEEDVDVLAALLQRAHFVEAEKPVVEETGDRRVLRGIYRRVDADTPL